MKHKTLPGSLISDRGFLYIVIRRKKYSTGLRDTKQGRALAMDLWQRIWESIVSGGNGEIIIRPTIKEAFEDYKKYKQTICMESTLNAYEYAFQAVIVNDSIYLEPDLIEEQIQTYIKKTKNTKLTINNYLRDLQTFFNWCAKKKLMPPTTFKIDYKQKAATIENEPYTITEVQSLVSYFRNIAKDPEFAILIEFMCETGARMVDCLTLKREQITSKNTIIWKNKKTKAPEERPISRRAIELLNELDPSKHRDKIFRWSYASTSRLHRRLIDAYDHKSIEFQRKGRAFQEFRVTFRMRLLEKRVPENYIQWLMRHKSIETTISHYTYHEYESIRGYLDKV